MEDFHIFQFYAQVFTKCILPVKMKLYEKNEITRKIELFLCIFNKSINYAYVLKNTL